MIKITRNVKRSEKRKLGIKRSSKVWNFSGLRNFAAQNRPLRKWPSAAKLFRSPYMASAKSRLGCENGPPLRNKFRSPTHPSAKPPLGTRVPFRSTVPSFRSCEMGCENGTQLRKSHLAAKCFRSPIATPYQILHLLRKWLFVAKWFSNFQIAMKWSPSFEMVAKWFSSFKIGCENVSIFSMGCENVFLFSLWLQNDLQATKWPPGYKNDLQNEERFAKTLCKAKESCENAKRASQPCI